jgi:hypothetical protein
MRNMQALGYGHQQGVPCIVAEGSAILIQRAGPHAGLAPEDWVKLMAQAHGEKVTGAGYIYWNDTPEDLTEAIKGA